MPSSASPLMYKLLAALLALLALSSTAQAQTDETAGEPLWLIVRAPNTSLQPEPLRAAIAAELDTAVELSTGSEATRVEVIAVSNTLVRVAVRGPGRAPVERNVELPGAQATETLALLVANLVRDEASELLLELRPLHAAVKAPDPDGCAPWQGRTTAIGADFVPYLGTSLADGPDIERAFSFNLLGGITGGIRGFELGAGLNIVTRAMCGAQLSWGVNLVHGPAKGAQIGLVDVAAGRVDGVQLGLLDVAGGALTGGQLGLIDVAAGPVTGFQLGLVDVASGGLEGAQIGLLNIAARPSVGLQLGQLNIAAGGLEGSQVGLVNISNKRVSGAMIGLLNVAEDADAAIGLVSILTHGRTHLDIWGTDFGFGYVGVEHGGKVIHNIYGIGVGHRDDPGVVLSAALGLGARVVDGELLYLDIDAMMYALLIKDDARDRYVWGQVAQLRVPVALRLSSKVALFVAPALNVSFADAGQPLSDPALYHSTRLSKASASTEVRMWPGLSLGLRLF